jgi:YidC/Oxa1 family membrane protein insertase
MEKKTLIALFLTIVVLFFFQMYFSPKEQPTPPKEQSAKTETAGKETPPKAEKGSPQLPLKAAAQPAVEKKATKDISVETPLFTVVFTDLGGGIKHVILKKYTETVKGPEGKEIVQDIKPYLYIPRISVTGNNQAVVYDRNNFVPNRESLVVRDKPETLVFSGVADDGRKIKKSYTFHPDTYTMDMTVETDVPAGEKLSLDFAVITDKNPSSYNFKGPFFYNGKKLEQIEKLEKPVDVTKDYGYVGFDEGYFAFIWIPQPGAVPPATVLKADTGIPVLRLAAAGGKVSGRLFFGPKQTQVLKSLNVKAEKIIDYGWFDIIAKPLIMVLDFFYKFLHNYGIAIILLTILIKIVFYPLSIKSFKSMKEMQKMQPQIAKLKEKHKNDKQKLNQEMMEMYRKKGVNPMGGCLPMVIQIPVFFALYRALSSAIELRHAPFMFWINDLSAPEDLYTFNVMGYEVPIRILPLIMGGTQLIQQKMTPTSVDPMQEKMMLIMPIVFTFLFWGFSSGLVLYWLVNNVISIAQQYYFNKKA